MTNISLIVKSFKSFSLQFFQNVEPKTIIRLISLKKYLFDKKNYLVPTKLVTFLGVTTPLTLVHSRW